MRYPRQPSGQSRFAGSARLSRDALCESNTIGPSLRSFGIKTMRIQITRDSVCMGDDVHAPHSQVIHAHDSSNVTECIELILRSYELPLIHGGRATWVLMSRKYLAVVAQQWKMPKLLGSYEREIPDLKYEDGVLHVHFVYLVQHDPDVVFDIMWKLPSP